MRKRGVIEADRCEPRFAGARTRPTLVRLAKQIDHQLAPTARALSAKVRTAVSAIEVGAGRVAGVVTRPAVSRRHQHLDRLVDQLPPPPSGRSVSVITLSPWSAPPLASVGGSAPQVVVAEPGVSRVAAMAAAADGATGDVVCFLPDPVDAPDPAWLARLTTGIDGDVVATTPTLLHPPRPGLRATHVDLRVRSAGYEVELDPSGAPRLRSTDQGQPPHPSAPPREVVAAPLQALAVARTALVDAGGLVDLGDDDAAAVDLITRLRARGGRVRHQPSALAFDGRPVAGLWSLHRPHDPAGAAWARVVDRCGPALRRSAADGPGAATSWAITTAVPSARASDRWGDWHFAQALARSLRRAGQHATVQRLDEADSLAGRSCDLHLVLHGLGRVRRSSGQGHILWVISHPETVTTEACDEADLVLVASARFAAHLRDRTSTPVEVLLQATDHHRFRPMAPTPRHRHDVTVVAKTREVLRPIVADAITAGLRPAVHGGGWRSLIDPRLVVTDHLDNQDLPAVYSSAGVVLNDHWDSMREWGFVSNRLFDVLACGAPVVSDEVEGLDETFGGAVATYRTPDDLRSTVETLLRDPVGARARAELGRAIVLADHTFDHRADALIALADRHVRPSLPRMEPQP